MGERQRTGTVNPASQNTCMHSPVLSEDAENFGVRPWSSTGDPACPPHPWGSGSGRNERGQTCCRAARKGSRKPVARLTTPAARLAHRLSPAAAANRCGPCVHDASGQHTRERPKIGCPKHHPGLEVFPHVCDLSTSHVEETQGQSWIEHEELSLNSFKATL